MSGFGNVLSLSYESCCDVSSEYLLGMGKRKQARRKYGLDMQKVKDRNELLAARKEVRSRIDCRNSW